MRSPRLERPHVISSTAFRTHYSKPVIRFVRGEEVEFSSAVEIFVATDRPIPATAITPVLFIGDVELDFEATEEGATGSLRSNRRLSKKALRSVWGGLGSAPSPNVASIGTRSLATPPADERSARVIGD